MRWVLVVAVFAVGCIKPAETQKCGEFTCGLGAICSPDGSRCVAPETVSACSGLAEGDRCVYTGISDGVCREQICVPGGCGNGMLETALGEVCDDGNFASGDGCRGDCLSDERCGDGIADLVAGELCDCGEDGASMPVGCDTPNSDDPNATCRLDCTPARCGDLVIDAPRESCDDGNNEPGDGCASDCSGRWTRMDSGTIATFLDVDARAPNDAWAVGDRTIRRYDGTKWQQVDFPSGTSGFVFTSVHLAASGDAFVVGHNPSAPTVPKVARYHSGGWAALTYDTSGVQWNVVAGAGSSVYLVGSYTNASQVVTSYAAKLDGSGQVFTNENTPSMSDDLSSLTVSPGGTPYASSQLNNIYTATGNVWASLPGGPSGWRIAAPMNNQLFAFANSTGGRVWNGTSVATIGNSASFTGFLDVDAIPNLALVVGGRGFASFCSPTECSNSDTKTLSNLRGVTILDDKHAFLVGEDGTILY